MKLARELGFPSVRIMLDKLSTTDILEWMAFFSEESFLGDELDTNFAELKYLILRNPKAKFEDFMPRRWKVVKGKKKELSPEQLKLQMDAARWAARQKKGKK